MAWIDTVADDDAEGRLATLYRRIKAGGGHVANILRIQSLDPGALDAHLGLYKAIMFAPSQLTRRQREMLGAWVSALNSCHY